MKVKLGNTYSAEEVLAAFSAAAETLQTWETETVLGESIQDGSSLIKSQGAEAYATYEEKRFVFFGPKVRKRGDTHFTLFPLCEGSLHSEVEIVPFFYYGADLYVTEFYISHNPAASEFTPLLPTWEQFIRAFMEKLGETESVGT